MSSLRMLHNANKVTFIVQQYPDKKLPEILEILGMAAIDINAALWYANDAGWLKKPDPQTGFIELGKKVPTEWDFGPICDDLEDAIKFAFEHLARDENDLEEMYTHNWMEGYAPRDVMIVLKKLVNDNVLALYAIEDAVNTKPGDKPETYNFYTLYENRDKLWGRKQFDKDPLGDTDSEDIKEVAVDDAAEVEQPNE